MNVPSQPDADLEKRLSDRLMDVFIRAGLILVMVILCYEIFSPFLSLMVWALILAVAMYPAHQKLANKMGGKQGHAATVMVLAGILLIVVPTTVLVSSIGDSVRNVINGVRDNTLQIPPPSQAVAEWPVVGKKVYGVWSQAHVDLPSLVQSMQPKIGDLSKKALRMVASIGGSIVMFLFSFIIAGIIMAFGESGAQSIRAIFDRIVGTARGGEFTALSTATIRSRPRHHRGRFDPGHHRRNDIDHRRYSIGRCVVPDCAGPGNRAGSGNHCYLTSYWLYLVQRGLRHRAGDQLYGSAAHRRHG
jgi:hypothetical protein